MCSFIDKQARTFLYICLNIPNISYSINQFKRATLSYKHMLGLSTSTCSCWVFLCFHNPLNTDMDYRIFNVHYMWSFLCMRIHTGVGHTDNKLAPQHFLLWKTLTIFPCAPHEVQTSGLWISSLTLYQLSHPITQSLSNVFKVTVKVMETNRSILPCMSTVMPSLP